VSELPTAEHKELRQVVRTFMERRSSEDAVRAAVDSERGYDIDVWRQATEQLGLPALAVPEDVGGAGFGLREAGIAFEEAGRTLLPAPLLSSFLVTQTLVRSGAASDLLPDLAAGERLGALGYLNSSVTESDGTLAGEVGFVIDGAVADDVVVLAGDGLYLVSDGFTAQSLTVLDPTRRQAIVSFEKAPARRLGDRDLLDDVLLRAAAIVAAELTGVAGKLLDISVDYAKTRYQFGKPIGSFQAIKHKLVDMYVAVETARAASWDALWAADQDPAAFPLAAAQAKAIASESAVFVAAEAIQVHGGIGFTWEHPAHLYYRRAVTSELLFGSPAEHRERVATEIGL
jgi:alkylation response protein AidB-like acyl-CoA dehydrogenase